ncbi:Frizzled-5 [Schistosoma japonicum]|nr:Frizzled-5 [Schistosoma japonicum]
MPVMRTYGFGWPERMNCDLLPEGNECVSRSNTPTNHKTTTSSSSFNKDNTINMNNNHINQLNDVINENNQSIEHDLFTVIHQMNSNNHLYPSDLLQSTTNQLHSNKNFSSISPIMILNQLNEYLSNNHLLDKQNKLENKKKFSDKTNEINTKTLEKLSSKNQLLPVICLPCKCRDPFLNWMKPPLNEVITGGITGCLLSCYSPTFNNQSDKTFVTFWLGLWSVLCILSTLITVITFLADPNRFQYPERPIIYLSACYFMIALGYLLRVSLGHETVACDGSMLRISTTGPVQCSIVFLLTYVFGMASSVWWVILTLTWFLAAGLKWGTEAIAKYSQIYHFFAWFFPGSQAIIVLILSAVDGDPVSGLCTVGSTNLSYLRLFILAPMCIYLSLGTIFLLGGFIALFKIRNEIKLQTRSHLKTEKLEKLMIRIGIFGVLYTVPATVVIACYCYELSNRDLWHKSHNCPCTSLSYMKDLSYDYLLDKLKLFFIHNYQHSSNLHDKLINDKDGFILHLKPPNYANVQPEYAVFMLKYFMSLIVGITSGFWIWSSKTIDSWQSCIKRAFNRSYTINSKRLQTGTSVGILNHTGVLLSNRSPPPPPPPLPPPSSSSSSLLQPLQTNSNSIGWNTGQSKVWMNSNSNPKLSSGLNLNLNNCTTWQDDYITNNRLLPQPPSVSLECHHSTGIHHNHTMPIPGGSVIGTPGVSLSGIQVNSSSFTSGPLDGTAISTCSGTNMPTQQHTGRKIDANNLFIMSSVPITHI